MDIYHVISSHLSFLPLLSLEGGGGGGYEVFTMYKSNSLMHKYFSLAHKTQCLLKWYLVATMLKFLPMLSSHIPLLIPCNTDLGK